MSPKSKIQIIFTKTSRSVRLCNINWTLKSVSPLLSYLLEYKVRMGGNLSTLGENIIETLADRPESSHHCIFNPRENGSEVRFAIFILLYRKEGYAGYGKWRGEDVLRMRITPPDICSGVSQITYIYIRHKRPAWLWREYILAGVGGLFEHQVHYS